MSDELWRRDAVELAALIRDQAVTSTEVVTAHLERIEAVNPTVNAIVRVLAEHALDEAAAADRAVAKGERLGPLHGVPMTVKENIDVAGFPTTNSLPAFADATAAVDAPVVERMRAAGAIPIGRTNMPDLGLRVTTDSTLHGVTRNPWDLARTAGGSSGGEGASLATGMSAIGLGNDIGGSLRNPAHCCGIASIKPTLGVVPWADTLPFEDSGMSSQLMLVQGVMARRVADVRTGFLAVAGPHPRDPKALPVTLADVPPGRVRPRVAVLAEPPGGATHPGVAAAVRAAADVLAQAGHIVVEAVPPDYERAVEVWGRVLAGDLTVQLALLEAVMGEAGYAFLELSRDRVPETDLTEWTVALTARHELQRHWQQWHADHDVLLSPVWTQPAFVEGLDVASADGANAVLEMIRPVTPMNLLGLPAAVVPVGMVDGLPVGVQVSGWQFSDLRCLTVAAAIEAQLGLATPIDPAGA
jgi:amidase